MRYNDSAKPVLLVALIAIAVGAPLGCSQTPDEAAQFLAAYGSKVTKNPDGTWDVQVKEFFNAEGPESLFMRRAGIQAPIRSSPRLTS